MGNQTRPKERIPQTYRSTSQTAYGIVVGILGGIAEEDIGLGVLDFLSAGGVAVVVGRHLEIFCEKFGFDVQALAARAPGLFCLIGKIFGGGGAYRDFPWVCPIARC